MNKPLPLINRLTAELHAKITGLVPLGEIPAYMDGVICNLIVARCQSESVRANEDPEQVMKDYTAEMYDVACRALTVYRSKHGGVSLLTQWTPLMVTAEYAKKQDLLKVVNLGYAKDGAKGVVVALRLFGMKGAADVISRRVLET